jgi:hypothetical protein
MEDPYLKALQWIEASGESSDQLAKAILSLYNDDAYSWSVGACLSGADLYVKSLILEMVTEYASFGDTQELYKAGQRVREMYPGLVELGLAMQKARESARPRWDKAASRRAKLNR